MNERMCYVSWAKGITLWIIRNNDAKRKEKSVSWNDVKTMITWSKEIQETEGLWYTWIEEERLRRKTRKNFSYHRLQFLSTREDLLWNCPVLQKWLPLVLVVSSVVIFRMITTSKACSCWAKPSVQKRKPWKGPTLVQLTLGINQSSFSMDGILIVLKLVSIIKRSLKGHIS